MPVNIRTGAESDVPRLTEIYNAEVLGSIATFDTVERTETERMQWFRAHGAAYGAARYPLLVAEMDGWMGRWLRLALALSAARRVCLHSRAFGLCGCALPGKGHCVAAAGSHFAAGPRLRRAACDRFRDCRRERGKRSPARTVRLSLRRHAAAGRLQARRLSRYRAVLFVCIKEGQQHQWIMRKNR